MRIGGSLKYVLSTLFINGLTKYVDTEIQFKYFRLYWMGMQAWNMSQCIK